MSASEVMTRGRRIFMASVRSGQALKIGAAALLVLAVLIVLALLYGDLPGVLRVRIGLGQFFRHYPYATGFGLLYIEESGIPLPAPGDVFVLYVGAHVPRNWFAWIGAWLGLIVAVTLGATNLFFISRRYGRRLVESRFAEYIHLSSERLVRAEEWFKRYGMLAIIFGRHIPGFRVPITVAAGAFRVGYPMFAVSVAISTAIWAGVVMFFGVNYGPRVERFLGVHSWMYIVWAAIVAAVIATQVIRTRRDQARRQAVEEPVAG